MRSTVPRIGVIGVGHMGRRHLEKLAQSPNADLIGCFDVHSERAAWARQQFDIRVYDQIDSLLFDVDGVVIATPTPSHYGIALRALEMGADLMIEKPISLDVKEAEALVDRAKDLERVIQIGFLERYRLEELRKGSSDSPIWLMEARRLNLQPGNERSLDVIFDVMIHDIDLALWTIRGNLVDIMATGGAILTEQTDVASARLQFDSGAVANLYASRVAPERRREVVLHDREKTTIFDLISNEVHTANAGSLENLSHNIDALSIQIEHFIQSIQEGKSAKVTAEDGLNALLVAKAIQDKILLRGDKPLALPMRRVAQADM